MELQLFSFSYFLALIICAGAVVGLYFLLRRKSPKTQTIVLFSLLLLGLALHFLKMLWPPYSTDPNRLLRDIWFINICGANIAVFPFLFFSKSQHAKDYMFYIGVISGLLALLYPIEPIQMTDQAAQWIDIIRFYYHHTMLLAVPLLMVVLRLHQLSWKRVWSVPFCLLALGLFIMMNQVLQSELGFIGMRGDDITKIPYKNNSLLWGPDNSGLSAPFTILCPEIFTKIPFGPHAGETKYWPLIWLAVPITVYLIPLCFLISLIFDHKNFKADCLTLKNKCHAWRTKRGNKNKPAE